MPPWAPSQAPSSNWAPAAKTNLVGSRQTAVAGWLSNRRMNSFPLPAEPFAHADLDGRPRSARTLSSAGCEPVALDSPAGRAAAALARAWASDDACSAEGSRAERTAAAWFLRMAIREGQGLNRHVSADLALLADLLRRSGDCQAAIAVAQRGLASSPPEGVGSLLLLQLRLARAGDEERHNLGEAVA